MIENPAEILAESFRIIEREVAPHSFSPDEWAVVRRMIHASGDIDLAGQVEFRHAAALEGILALGRKTPIVTDVTMVRAGINRSLLQELEIPVHCFIDDPEANQRVQEAGKTRSYWAMEKAVRLFPNAVFAIGNAPTALLALAEALHEKRVEPSLVLAMPVGFVGVEESKNLAREFQVPTIVVAGRKGGSAMTAAALNALLHLAKAGRPA